MARVLDWEPGDPGLSPHSAMETHWVTLGQSQTLSPTYLTVVVVVVVVVVRIPWRGGEYPRPPSIKNPLPYDDRHSTFPVLCQRK